LYTFVETLGEGAFGKVCKALFKPSGEEMAVKIIKEERMGNEANRERLIQLTI